jgi:hypothetical protein
MPLVEHKLAASDIAKAAGETKVIQPRSAKDRDFT